MVAKKRIFTLLIAVIIFVTTIYTGTIYINAEEIIDENLKEVMEGERNEKVIGLENEGVWYHFIPRKTGIYHFYSVNSGNTRGAIYDSKKELIKDESGGGNLDFNIEIELEEGQNYYLDVNYCLEQDTGTITWIIEEKGMKDLEDEEGNTEDTDIDTGEKIESGASSENEKVTENVKKLLLSINGISYIINENDISIGAACTTNDSGVLYKWESYNLDKGNWSLISDWGESNWSSWKPEKGNYWLQVQVQTVSGLTAEYTICFATQKDYSIENLTLDGFCYIFQRDRIDLGTAYTTNCANVQFKWMAYNLDTEAWMSISDWSTGNWVSWVPSMGNYWIVVQAKTSEKKYIQNIMCFAVDRNYGPQLNLNGICYNFQNDQIDVGVAYDCTDPNVEFKWLSYNLDTEKWDLISEWNGGNWASWLPQKGNYWLMVQARMSDGTIKSYTICFFVDKNYKLSISYILPVKYDDKVTLSAGCTHKSKTVIFKWMIYDVKNSIWDILVDWTNQKSVMWIPKSGDYWVYLQASDEEGNLETYTISYHVANSYEIQQPDETMLYVGMGEKFTTISDAIEYAKQIGVSNNSPVKIIIAEGCYNEQIILNDIHGLVIEGENRTNTIIEYSGSYPDCVMHLQGDIKVSNLTIREKNNTYAAHVDPLDTGISGCVTFANCSIQGGTCALGYGSGAGTTVQLLNCELSAYEHIIYAHNSPYLGDGQKLIINGCSFLHTTEQSIVAFDDAAYSYFRRKSPMVVIAKDNVYNGDTKGKIVFRKNFFTDEVLDYIPKSEENIVLSPDNRNNVNISGLEKEY